jgi:hypothetical protein
MVCVMFQTNAVVKIKSRVPCLVFFPRKSFSLCDSVEKYVSVRQATDDTITRCRRNVISKPFNHAITARL